MKLLIFVQIFFMHSHIENYSCKSFSLVHQISYTVTDLVRAKKASICFLFFKNIQTLTQTYLYTYTFQYIHRLFGFFFYTCRFDDKQLQYLWPYFASILPGKFAWLSPFSAVSIQFFAANFHLRVSLCHCAHPLSTPAPHFPSLPFSLQRWYHNEAYKPVTVQ